MFHCELLYADSMGSTFTRVGRRGRSPKAPSKTFVAALAAVLMLASPAFAQLSPSETQMKLILEQKARQSGLTSQEVALYNTLVQKDVDTEFSKSAQKPAGEIFGWATSFIAAGTAALALCAVGIIAACPLVATMFGG